MFSFCLRQQFNAHLLSDLVLGEKDAVAKAALEDKKANAAGILGGNLGLENYAKFITDENVREPHLIWSALLQHFQSNSSQNQVVVYQDFLKIGYNSTLEQLIKDIDVGISNLRSVGIKIVKFDKSTLDEKLLAEYVVNLLPQSMENSKEIIFTKRPLDLDSIKEYLNSKQLSSTGIPSNAIDSSHVKTESAMKTTIAYCENGQHNESAHHSRTNCYQLHPEKAPESYKNHKSNSGKKKANAVTSSDNISGVYICVSDAQAFSIVQNASLIFLNSCCSDHMFPDKRNFVDYETIKSSVNVASGQSLTVQGKGLINIKNSDGIIFSVKALHVSGLTHSLLSLARLSLNDCGLLRHKTKILTLSFSLKILLKT
jgi:hypothetical protein